MTFWYKLIYIWKKVGQSFSNLLKCNPFKSSPVFQSLSLLSFPVFCLSSSIVLSRYFVISPNPMTTWSMLKLPKIAWPRPLSNTQIYFCCILKKSFQKNNRYFSKCLLQHTKLEVELFEMHCFIMSPPYVLFFLWNFDGRWQESPWLCFKPSYRVLHCGSLF